MRYLSIIIIILTTKTFAQDIALNRTISWGQNKTAGYNINDTTSSMHDTEYFYFKDAAYPDLNTLLPCYYELIKLNDYYISDNFIITDQVYKTVDNANIHNVKSLDKIPEKLTWQSSVRYLNKKPHLKLSFIPLVRNPENGEIKLLVSFTVKQYQKEPYINKNIEKKSTSKYSKNSLLASGKWCKIKIPQSGIYKLTYSDILSMGFTEPANIRIYGNGGKKLPYMNSQPRPDDIKENAIYMETGSDTDFNEGDFILFYAEGPVTWGYDTIENIFKHTINPYSDASYYFLTTDLGPGKKIISQGAVSESSTHNLTSFDDYACHERNIVNLVKSGRQWLGGRIENASFDTSFYFPEIVLSSPVTLKTNVVSRAGQTSLITVNINDKIFDQITIDRVDISSSTSVYAKQKSSKIIFTPQSETINIKISYTKLSQSDEGWLDYIILNARSNLILDENPLFFRDWESAGQGNVTQFNISNAGSNTLVWDISDIYNVSKVNTNLNGSLLNIKVRTDSLKEFVAFNKTGTFPKPVIDAEIQNVENQNLHGVGPHNLIIITHPDFHEQSEQLAEFHRNEDNLSVYVVTTDKIFNEFSSGKPDVSAMRDFVKIIYDKSGDDENSLRYLLLFGDGSYNNISNHPENPNFILTYQSSNSLHYSASYVTDDFFGFLDDDEGGSVEMDEYLLDIGLGRLPVKNTEEAQAVVDKILAYSTSNNMLDWRNILCFVGDDGEYGDGIKHMGQANELGNYIMNNHPEFIVKKILLDAYKQVTTSTGPKYPDVERAINDNFNNGMLIFNYSGHGGENGITKEKILQKSDIENLKNKDKYPLLITATCEFSRFDDLSDEDGTIIEKTSAGETAILNPDGGGIALLSTTRLVYSDRNYDLNRNFYRVVFDRDSNNRKYALGDIIRITKNNTDVSTNKLIFILLGDPALKLAYPEFNIVTDSVNNKAVTEKIDTLKAFSKITISGHICDHNNIKMENFNGVIYPSIFDKIQDITTFGNDGINTFQFESQENIIYKGKATVTNGEFGFSFIVPKDISYNIGQGKISYYANDSITDANGYFKDILVGGTSNEIIYDNYGPEIDLYLNDTNFVSGGITDKDPVIYARLRDNNGINTSGNGIGHDIVGILDENINHLVVLNNYYEADIDNYNSGIVKYQLKDLNAGVHILQVKVWDIFNNSSEESIAFRVVESDGIFLEKVYNYPNPVTDNTVFQFEHNKSGDNLKIYLYIYDLTGRLVYSERNEELAAGYRSEMITWDGKSIYGGKLPKGIYIYRLRVETSEGQVAEKSNKLVIIN
jgi:hypothetical protein